LTLLQGRTPLAVGRMKNMKVARTFITALALTVLAAPAMGRRRGKWRRPWPNASMCSRRDGYEHPAEALSAPPRICGRSMKRHRKHKRLLLLGHRHGGGCQRRERARAAATADRLRAPRRRRPLGAACKRRPISCERRMAEASGQTDVAADLCTSRADGTASRLAAARHTARRRARGVRPSRRVDAARGARAPRSWTRRAGDGEHATHKQHSIWPKRRVTRAARRSTSGAARAAGARARRNPTQLRGCWPRRGASAHRAMRRFQARLFNIQAQLAALRGDKGRPHARALEEALALAVQSRSTAPRSSNARQPRRCLRAPRNRPADALRLAERALPIAKRYNDVSTEARARDQYRHREDRRRARGGRPARSRTRTRALAADRRDGATGADAVSNTARRWRRPATARGRARAVPPRACAQCGADARETARSR